MVGVRTVVCMHSVIPETIIAFQKSRAGWSAKRTKSGKVVYINHDTKITTWDRPKPLPPGGAESPEASRGTKAEVACCAYVLKSWEARLLA